MVLALDSVMQVDVELVVEIAMISRWRATSIEQTYTVIFYNDLCIAFNDWLLRWLRARF
jgi:hypothetical protein